MSIITLTTDFGTRDGYVGAMKGKILSINKNAHIIDITHEIAPQNVEAAAWALLRSTPVFPKKSIHIAVVDPEVGSVRNPLLLQLNHQIYIGPDNGIFTLLLDRFGSGKLYQISKSTLHWESHQSFDGLALFAPVAAHISLGLPLKRMGREIQSCVRLSLPIPETTNKIISGIIILFDNFGNAITNISENDLVLSSISSPKITWNQQESHLSTHYSEKQNEPFGALINSDGRLELFVKNRSFQKIFSARISSFVTVSSSLS